MRISDWSSDVCSSDLRRGAPMAPRMTVALGALAAAAVGNFGLRLFHYQDAGLMVLIWQFGSVALLSALAGWSGGAVLHWPHARIAGSDRSPSRSPQPTDVRPMRSESRTQAEQCCTNGRTAAREIV